MDSEDFSSIYEDIKKHKLGYYYSENNTLKNICQTTGTEIEGEYAKHLTVHLTMYSLLMMNILNEK